MLGCIEIASTIIKLCNDMFGCWEMVGNKNRKKIVWWYAWLLKNRKKIKK